MAIGTKFTIGEKVILEDCIVRISGLHFITPECVFRYLVIMDPIDNPGKEVRKFEEQAGEKLKTRKK